MNILKICGVALIAAFSVGILKIYKSEFVLPVSVVSSVVLLGAALATMTPISAYLGEMSSLGGFGVYFSSIMKAMGIGIVADTAASHCRDEGQASLASKVEFGAKILILSLALPIVKEICSAAIEVLK